MNRVEYEQDLDRRQQEHLKHVKVKDYNRKPWKPCMHDACPLCLGTGLKITGGFCIHNISCDCPKCQPTW